jgi:uncharacterized protein (DUF2344 family)
MRILNLKKFYILQIVLSQSCDLEQKKIQNVILAPVWPLFEFENEQPKFKNIGEREKLRNSRYISYHLLQKCEMLPNYQYYDRIIRAVYRHTCSVFQDTNKKGERREIRWGRLSQRAIWVGY